MELIQNSPSAEVERIKVLRKYEILDTPPDGSFDQITRLAAQLLEVPIAMVSLVDEDRIWFKSRYGVDVQEIGRDPGLCASAIFSNELYVVEDARNDPRTLANPLVAGEFGLQFYSAVPLHTREGFNLGTLCVIDKKPRRLSTVKKEILKSLGELVMNQIELRLEARVAVRNQNQVLSTAAHDLKNPLSIMPLLADMIMQNKNNPDAIDDISRQIKEAGKRMAKTIHELLENATDPSSLHLRLKHFGLDELLKGVVDANKTPAKKKDQSIRLKIQDSCSIFADYAKITEVADNLVNNAVKYSPPKTTITINLRKSGNNAIFEVKDQGPGLTRDDMKNLFRRFTSLSAQPTGGEVSTGLGLSIVKRFVEAHEGSIRAESEGSGTGAVFIVSLPLSEE